MPEEPPGSEEQPEEQAGDQLGEPAQKPAEGEDTALTAASSALARARDAARAKGLRPGSRPARTRRRPGEALRSGTGPDARDPALLGEQLDRLVLDRGWNLDVAVGSVMGRWPSIVGADVALHCSPTTFEEGILTIRAESTAWATQLRLMSATLLGRLQAEVGDAVTELRIVGPTAPSWSRGFRRSEGRGPRDTYG